jgi:flagellar motor switch protein FliN
MSNAPLSADAARLALTVATAAAGVLPSPEPLTPTAAAPGSDQVAAPFAGAVVGDLEGQLSGRIAVLVGEDLVAALAASPIGGLDLASALQPTLDAMAAAMHGQVGAAREVDLRLVADDMGPAYSCSNLVGSTATAAVLLQDYTLRAALYAPALAAEVEGGATLPAQPAQAFPLASVPAGSVGRGGDGRRRGIELLHGVDMEVTVEIGRARMTVRELLDLSPGAVLELDRAAGSPADLLVNGRLIARGEVVVVDEDFGLRITEIVTDAAVG